jgi:hypothetical protein
VPRVKQYNEFPKRTASARVKPMELDALLELLGTSSSAAIDDD